MSKNYTLLTGATGFIGKNLLKELTNHRIKVRCALRCIAQIPNLKKELNLPQIDYSVVGDIGPNSDWMEALQDVDTVIHLAGIAHITDPSGRRSSDLYHRVNVGGMEKLCMDAAHSGIQKMIYVSTIKVNGESTSENDRISETSPIDIHDSYSLSKWCAENIVNKWAKRGAFKAFIIRPPLVYGPFVKGNFLRLLKAVDRNFPMPLRGAENKRSLVFVENLIDFIVACIKNKKLKGGVFYPTDNEDVSIRNLIYRLSVVMKKKDRSFIFPKPFLELILALGGKKGEINKLLLPFCVDSTQTMRQMAWKPPSSVEEGIEKTVNWYMSR